MREYGKLSNGRFSAASVNEMVANTIAQQRLEGVVVTQDEALMLRKYASGEITMDEYKAWAVETAGMAQ